MARCRAGGRDAVVERGRVVAAANGARPFCQLIARADADASSRGMAVGWGRRPGCDNIARDRYGRQGRGEVSISLTLQPGTPSRIILRLILRCFHLPPTVPLPLSPPATAPATPRHVPRRL